MSVGESNLFIDDCLNESIRELCSPIVGNRNASYEVCCFVPAQKLYLKWLVIPAISAPRSASSAYCTPGTKNCNRTLTHNALPYDLIDSQGTTQFDGPCDPLVEVACLSDGGARGYCESALRLDRSDVFPKAHGERFVHDSVNLLPPAVRANGDSRHSRAASFKPNGDDSFAAACVYHPSNES